MAKNDNLLAILWLLRSRGRMTAPQLAEELEISVRTVYRYIDTLCASGVPILSEPGQAGGYSLLPSFRGAPLVFDPDELVTLFQAAVFARQAGYPRLNALESALQKIRQNLSPEQEAELDRHGPVLGVAPRDQERDPGPWGAALESAAAGRQSVALLYRKAGAAEAERRLVDPYAVAYRAGLWYLVGRCHLRQALREFRLDRIEAVEAQPERFEYPQDFEIHQYLGRSWVKEQVSRGPHALIRLQGSRVALAELANHWYIRHCVVEQQGDEILLRIDLPGLEHFRGHLIGMGQRIRVLEPESLRRELAAMARELEEHHQRA